MAGGVPGRSPPASGSSGIDRGSTAGREAPAARAGGSTAGSGRASAVLTTADGPVGGGVILSSDDGSS